MSRIITVPQPLLHQKSQPVSLTSAHRISKLIKELTRVLVEAENPPGIGLSAVQIGKPVQIFLARKDLQSPSQAFINPEIIWKSKAMTDNTPLEGCLSVPGYYGLIQRHQEIKLKYQTIHNSEFVIHHSKFKGFLATVIQHEMDHLNGILFIDRVLKQGNKLYKVQDGQFVETSL